MLTGMADNAHDVEATAIAAEVMRALWQPVTEAKTASLFPTVSDWMEGLWN